MYRRREVGMSPFRKSRILSGNIGFSETLVSRKHSSPLLTVAFAWPNQHHQKLEGIMQDREKTQAIVDALIESYWMELETVINYLANSVNLDGVRAEEIKKSLAADVQAELQHASQIANRIKTIDGRVPGSQRFSAGQKSLQPPADSTDVVTVIKGVIDAEEAAISQYEKIIRLCDGYDFVTQDMCIALLADEQHHRREFIGFLKEYEQR